MVDEIAAGNLFLESAIIQGQLILKGRMTLPAAHHNGCQFPVWLGGEGVLVVKWEYERKTR